MQDGSGEASEHHDGLPVVKLHTMLPERITIDGYYAPPFGVVGYVLDRALLSIVARGTARWFLTLVVGALR